METADLARIMASSRKRTRELLDLKGGWPVLPKPRLSAQKKLTMTAVPSSVSNNGPTTPSQSNNVTMLPISESSKTIEDDEGASISPKKKRKLTIPEGTSVHFSDSQIEVRGPLGALYFDTKQYKDLYEPNSLNVLSNTYHKLIQNAIRGVTYGYIIKLKVKGTGYKVVKCEDGLLTVRLGHSHLSKITIPEHITVSFNKLQQILCTGTSKQKLAEFAARVKRMRVRTAFRAKGIFEVSEPLPNKAPGKAGRKG